MPPDQDRRVVHLQAAGQPSVHPRPYSVHCEPLSFVRADPVQRL